MKLYTVSSLSGMQRFAENSGLYYVPGDLALTEDFQINKSVEARGFIISKQSIRCSFSMESGWNMESGGSIVTGGSIKSHRSILATESMESGGSMEARGDMRAGWSMKSGGSMRSGWNMESGASMESGWFMESGGSMTAGGDMTAGWSIESGKSIESGGSIVSDQFVHSMRYDIKAKSIKTRLLPHWRQYYADLPIMGKYRELILDTEMCWDDIRKAIIDGGDAQRIYDWDGWHWIIRGQIGCFLGLIESFSPPERRQNVL